MENSLTNSQYQALLKIHQHLYHCEGWDWYLKLHAPKCEQDFKQLLDLLCMIRKCSEEEALTTLKKLFQNLSLIATIDYVQANLLQLNAPADFQVLLLNRLSENRSNSLEQIQWQIPSRANAPEIKAHLYEWSSVITTLLSLESKSQKQYYIATNCVSTKDFFAITDVMNDFMNDWPYTFEPWLSWFLYLQTIELNEIQTWSSYKEVMVSTLINHRKQATMLFDLQLQILTLIWPKEVPIPDLTLLAAAAAVA